MVSRIRVYVLLKFECGIAVLAVVDGIYTGSAKLLSCD